MLELKARCARSAAILTVFVRVIETSKPSIIDGNIGRNEQSI